MATAAGKRAVAFLAQRGHHRKAQTVAGQLNQFGGELAGFGDRAIIDSDLVEWNYGKYEGLTPKQIDEVAPGWLIFRDGCPGGEAPEQASARVDRVIARSRAVAGDTALFAHGHLLRVFAARWIGLPASGGQHFLLNTGTLCVLGYYHEIPAVQIWNRPLLDEAA